MRSYRRSSAQSLVDGVGLNEGQSPRCERGAEGGSDDDDRVAGGRERRHHQSLRRSAPVGIGEDPGCDIGDEDGGEADEDVLHAVERSAKDEERHADRGHGHADPSRDAEQLASGGHPCELGACRADVRHDESGERAGCWSDAVAMTYETDDALPGRDSHPSPEAVEEDQGDGRQRQHPEELVAVLGTED